MTFYGLGYSREEKIRASEEIVRKAYYKNSLIQHLVNVKIDNSSDEEFLKLGRRFYIPADWYTSDNIAYDLALNQFGENVAFSEKKYFLEEILKDKRVERIKLPEVNPQILKEQIEQMNNFNPTIMFAPVQFFVDLTYTWSQIDPDYSTYKFNNVRVQNRLFEVYWSNKYIPFDVFILLNKSFGKWMTKPSLDNRFFVKIEDSEKPDQLELTMYTTFKFLINKPQRIKILEMPQKLPDI
jgi:hypothetical protein